MNYVPGEYHIIFFNEVGAKRKIKIAKSHSEAQTKANKFKKKHPTCSTSILLVMNNSREIHDKWGTIPLKQKTKNDMNSMSN